jgi:hypothetical protein
MGKKWRVGWWVFMSIDECWRGRVRLGTQYSAISSTKILGKMNGAVGNFNAHVVAVPNVRWMVAIVFF